MIIIVKGSLIKKALLYKINSYQSNICSVELLNALFPFNPPLLNCNCNSLVIKPSSAFFIVVLTSFPPICITCDR